ncbi:MAG: AbrB/MazE/SpoVT family DNA-binding domain-containing protein [Terriglobales bacterium]
MTTHLVLDKAGRVVIPKPVREELRLEPGDTLEMETTGEHITLRPLRGTGPLAKEHGVWVFRAGNPLPASVTDDLLQRIREERDEANLGETNRGETGAGTGARIGTESTSKGKSRRL